MAEGYRLVALDVDGTLKPRNGPVTTRVRVAIAAAGAAGVHVALATGRMFRSTLPFAEALGLRTPIICNGGATIRDPASGAILYRQGIPLPLVRAVVVAARARGLSVAAYLDDDLRVERVSADSPFAGYVARAGAQVVDDHLEHLAVEPCHLAVVSDEARTRGLVRELQEEFGSTLAVTSGHPLLAEIDSPGVSKGAALAHLASLLGVPRTGVLAIGDDWNDIAMLDYAGLGIAMGDAQPEVLAVADVVAPSADEDGVAWALERFVLDGAVGRGHSGSTGGGE